MARNGLVHVPIFKATERLRTTFFNSANVKMHVLRHELLRELNAMSRQNYCRNYAQVRPDLHT